ncbi:MAG: hypothetical protein AAFX76_12835 [Planctomycetota bacterium]
MAQLRAGPNGIENLLTTGDPSPDGYGTVTGFSSFGGSPGLAGNGDLVVTAFFLRRWGTPTAAPA